MPYYFTRDKLVKIFHSDVTTEEHFKLLKEKKDTNNFFSSLWRSIWPSPRKLFLVRYKTKDGHGRGAIASVYNEEEMLIELAISLLEQKHCCSNPSFNEACEKCRKTYDDVVEILNKAEVVWIGWPNKESSTVIRHIYTD